MQIKVDNGGPGDVQNIAAMFANNQVWIKTQSLPLFYEATGVTQNFLMKDGSASMNVNGSVTPQIFEYITPISPTAFYFAFAAMTLVIVDAAITPSKFGGLPALTNGISLEILDDADILKMDFSPGLNGRFKTNADFFHIGGAAIQTLAGSDMINISWESRRIGILAALRPGWKIRATIRDDLTGLDSFQAAVTGALVPNDVIFSY